MLHAWIPYCLILSIYNKKRFTAPFPFISSIVNIAVQFNFITPVYNLIGGRASRRVVTKAEASVFKLAQFFQIWCFPPLCTRVRLEPSYLRRSIVWGGVNSLAYNLPFLKSPQVFYREVGAPSYSFTTKSSPLQRGAKETTLLLFPRLWGRMLSPDVTSLDWILIGKHTQTLTLHVDCSNITQDSGGYPDVAQTSVSQ